MRRALGLLLAAFMLLGGCRRAAGGDAAAYAPPPENRLVIYTAHKQEVYSSIVKEFEERTGVWVQVESGGTTELLERIAAEAAEPRCDLMFGGGVESLESYESFFAPYESPCAKDVYQNYRSGGGRWTPFSSLPMVLIYNPKLVADDRPTGWSSLLDPRWRGRIAFANPEVSGSSYTALATMLLALPLDQAAALERFAANLDGHVLDGSGDVAGAVAGGSCLVGVTLEETALKAIAAGDDIAMVYPREGTSTVPDGAAIVAGCAHEDNARRFVDFILSADVQRRLSVSLSRRSVRTDLFIPEEKTPGLLLLDYDLKWASQQRPEILRQWNTLVGEAAS